MEYFAGANTRKGFYSIFDECFKNTERLYILKGSSGCGKSTLMRRIAEKAKRLNLDTDLIYCSADSDSLDGVIIPKLGIAVADGTAPHSMDVKYPCVRENIVNLGQFWDESKLIPKRNDIISLTDRKSFHYKNAYGSLSAFGTIDDLKKSLVSQSILRSDLEGCAFKMAEKLCNGANGHVKRIFTSAFTSSGVKTLSTFGEVENLYRVIGKGAEFLMNAISGIAREKGENITESLSPTNPCVIDSIYFEGSNSLITMLDIPPCKTALHEKTVSTSRFTNNEILTGMRSKIRALERLSDEILLDAQKELASARSVHSKIESIYIPAMNFTALDEYTFELISKIFSE
ncbi:MAG: hypothetical protein IKM22_04895 [Clostridia bacterium]|nr:hypothetical protein [Clostridia bacterium]